MKDANEESKEPTKPQLTGAAAKHAMKLDEIRKHDQKLYRAHGQGLDTGAY